MNAVRLPRSSDRLESARAPAARQALVLREARYEDDDLRGLWELFRSQFDAYRHATLTQFLRLYEQLWLQNPARTADHVFGWVLQAQDGTLVGFIGVLPVKLKLGESEIIGGAGHSWVVLPTHRSQSLRLYQKLMTWAERHLLLFTTSLERPGQIHQLFGARKIPIEHFTQQALWLLEPERLTRVALEKAGHDVLADWSERFPLALAGKLLLRLRFLRHRRVRFQCTPMTVEKVSAFDAEFDRLWERSKHAYPITTVRDRAFLEWRHLRVPSLLGPSHVFACRHGGRLRGYVSVQERHAAVAVLPGHFMVTDLFYERDCPEVLYNLMNHVFAFAKANGCAVLEVTDCCEDLMRELRRLDPYVRSSRPWTYWYKAPTRELSERCARERWWPAGIDGDINI